MIHCGELRRKPGGRRGLRLVLALALGASAGIGAGHWFKASVSIVDGTSMMPTFAPGNRVFTMPITGGLERGDIVLLDDGGEAGECALKRVVGLPGEAIELFRGYVFVNRRLLVEPYLPKHTLTFPSQRGVGDRVFLGADQYFVLGDNRLYSVDSRDYGAVDRGQIKGRVPSPENMMRARFAPYTLPETGHRVIRPLEEVVAVYHRDPTD